jgi:HSP20 family molecular chaperone IbpA
MTASSSGLGSVHLRETGSELVLEVRTPVEVDPKLVSARLVDGVVEIRLHRAPHHYRSAGINGEACGV